jgi:NADH-quinone oxidoreductase subunit E
VPHKIVSEKLRLGVNYSYTLLLGLYARMIRPAKENLSTRPSSPKSKITDILAKYATSRGSLIPILQDIQEKFGYLSEEAMAELERLMGISANEIYGVATFYTQFRFSPPGQHTIRSCQGTACHVRGGHQLLQELQQHLGITAGQTTEDGKFDLERVACLGCCALAPVVSVDGKVHAQITSKKIPSILSQYAGQAETGKEDDDNT